MSTVTRVSWKEKEASIRALEVGGKVDPLALIQEALAPDHPCHGDFTWDVDQAAAERWRDQARKLIRAVGFEVKVGDVTHPVVQYVSSGDADALFLSLPKIRSKTKASVVLLAELAQLHAAASRAFGIAVAKQGLVGDSVVASLGSIRDQVASLKAGLEE